MSVYIKGMEMPKDGVYWCEIGVAGEIAMITIHGEDRKSFPLIPVHDHGDLIDRNASLHNLGRIVLPDDLAYTIGHDMAKRFFENAPTIIPADCKEERTVKWREWNTFVPASQADKEDGE